MDFIDDDIMQYVESHSQEESELLKELKRETHQKILQPRMISGHYQGRFLSFLSRWIQPEKILEIGTFTGYKNQIFSHQGDAKKIIPGLDFKFDLAFIDADKSNYSQYFDLILPKLNPKGIIVADNVLWSGKILQKNIPNKDTETLGLKEFNDKVMADKKVETLLLPIRDGLMICRKV
jgi:caffeoyl-CoA O-methyltransferase